MESRKQRSKKKERGSVRTSGTISVLVFIIHIVFSSSRSFDIFGSAYLMQEKWSVVWIQLATESNIIFLLVRPIVQEWSIFTQSTITITLSLLAGNLWGGWGDYLWLWWLNTAKLSFMWDWTLSWLVGLPFYVAIVAFQVIREGVVFHHQRCLLPETWCPVDIVEMVQKKQCSDQWL